MEVSIETGQLKVLEDFFQELSNADQRKIFIAAYRKASKPIIAAAQAGAPEKSGRLKKSIGSIEIPKDIAILVGAKKSGKYKGWHGHLVENGTKMRYRRSKKSASTGRVLGTHFFEEAFNRTEGQAYDAIEQEWYQAIDKMIIRTNKKLQLK
ncbi:MAG TPA: HK97 gp10 family phage protein [Bacteroidales bacterium]|nr:HK97 gp10 family phage protein [Bacteroidales bacterium]